MRSDITTDNQNPGSVNSDVAPLKDEPTTDPLESDALGSVEEDHQYWASYIVLGQAVLGIEAVLSIIYYLMTPKGLHRFAGIAIAALCLVVAPVIAAFAKKIAETSWRSKFVTVWMLVISGFLALSIGLDGWVDSPLRSLLVLPMIYVALSLPVRTVRLFVAVTFCELGLLVATDADWTRSVADVGLFASALWGVAILSVVWSAKRARLESSEILLRSSVITLAQTDSMTGCLNHAAFYKRLEAEIDRAMRHDQPLALLMVDLDRFKLLNDTYGHVAGDEALASVGSVLRARIRSFDIVGRIGGDEFAVVLPATGLSDATEIADRLRKALDHPDGVQITASVGVAELCRSEPTTSRLARDADVCLYNAKASGRDRTSSQVDDVLFTTTPLQQDEQCDTLIADLKNRDGYIRSANRAAIESRALLDAYESSPTVGLGFVDRDFRILRINDALAAVNGSLAKDQIGKTIEEIAPELWPRIRPALLQAMQTVEPITSLEISGEPPSDLGNLHYWSVSYYPVTVEGTLIGTAIVVLDQREHVRNAANKTVSSNRSRPSCPMWLRFAIPTPRDIKSVSRASASPLRPTSD